MALSLVLATLLPAMSVVGAGGLGAGAAVTTSVTTPYTVTFSETGLPVHTVWSVHVAFIGCTCNGVYKTGKSNLSTLTIPVTNGEYKYHVLIVPGYYALGSPYGTFNVSGANVSGISFTFRPVIPFATEFTETGLPNATLWSVSLTGNGTGQLGTIEHQTETSYGSSMVFALPNGTYLYRVSPVPGSFFLSGTSRGTFAVSGASPPPIAIAFTTPPLHPVKFSENGLPNGTNWSVRVDGHGTGGVPIHELLSSVTHAIVFSLPNGSYFYRVAQVLGFSINGSSSGTIVVANAPLSFNVTFKPLPLGAFYPVAFEETGLANGTHWSVTVIVTSTFGHSRTATQSSNHTTVFFLLQNGTYRYLVHGVRGYNILSGAMGTFGIHGGSPSVFVVHFLIIPTYTVTVTEKGLPNGTNWSVLIRTQFAGSTPWPVHILQTSNLTSMSFQVWNGTYCFKIYPVPDFLITAGVAAGSFTVSGGPPSVISVGFSADF